MTDVDGSDRVALCRRRSFLVFLKADARIGTLNSQESFLPDLSRLTSCPFSDKECLEHIRHYTEPRDEDVRGIDRTPCILNLFTSGQVHGAAVFYRVTLLVFCLIGAEFKVRPTSFVHAFILSVIARRSLVPMGYVTDLVFPYCVLQASFHSQTFTFYTLSFFT
jgi:hypothetical protein